MEYDPGARYEVPMEQRPSWRCYHCDATGDDKGGINAATHVVGRLGSDEARVFLRPHCAACLPNPPGRQDLGATEWRAYWRTSSEYAEALWAAADQGSIEGAETACHYQCPVCSQENVEDFIARDPVYAVAADRDEAACVGCVEEHPEGLLADADRRRYLGEQPLWQQ